MSTHRQLHILDLVALIIVVIGGINWGLVGLFNVDVVAASFGRASMVLARLIYILVGISAVYTAARAPAMSHFRVEPHERPQTSYPTT